MPNLNLKDDGGDDGGIEEKPDESMTPEMELGLDESPGVLRRVLPIVAGALVALLLAAYVVNRTGIIHLWGPKKAASVMVAKPSETDSQILTDSAMAAQFKIDSAQIASGVALTPMDEKSGQSAAGSGGAAPQRAGAPGVATGADRKTETQNAAGSAAAKKLEEKKAKADAAEAKKKADEKKRADAAEMKKKADEKKRADAAEAKKIAEKKRADVAEAKKKAAEKKLADAAEAKKTEAKKRADAAEVKKKAEEKKLADAAEAKKKAAEKKAADAAEAKKKADEKRLAVAAEAKKQLEMKAAAAAAEAQKAAEKKKLAETAARNNSYVEVPGYKPRRSSGVNEVTPASRAGTTESKTPAAEPAMKQPARKEAARKTMQQSANTPAVKKPAEKAEQHTAPAQGQVKQSPPKTTEAAKRSGEAARLAENSAASKPKAQTTAAASASTKKRTDHSATHNAATRVQPAAKKTQPIAAAAHAERARAQKPHTAETASADSTAGSESGHGRFSVQISSWFSAAKAQSEAGRFTAAGIHAFVTGSGRIFRVCIGRFASYAAAIARAETLVPMLESPYDIIQVK